MNTQETKEAVEGIRNLIGNKKAAEAFIRLLLINYVRWTDRFDHDWSEGEIRAAVVEFMGTLGTTESENG